MESSSIIKERYILIFVLTVNIIMAWNSVGFHHPDEHYVTLDYALKKMQMISTPPSWEEVGRFRSWPLPLVFSFFIAIIKEIGVDNPFQIVTFLRFISSMVGLWSTLKFCQLFRSHFKQVGEWPLFLYFMNLPFFIVFMHARTSSDNWATSFLLLGIYQIQKNKEQHLLNNVIGSVILTIACLFRFQVAIIVASYLLWYLFKTRTKWWNIFLQFLLPIGIISIIGFIIDSWCYGQWTFVPWNYYYYTLHGNKISEFGVQPFYWYFYSILIKLSPFWGIPLIVGVFYFLKSRITHWLSICTIPFFIFHSSISHKELRFIFPLSGFVTAMCFLEAKKYGLFTVKNWYVKTLIFVNSGLLLLFLFSPAYSPVDFYQFVYEQFKETTTFYVLKDKQGQHVKFELSYYTNPVIRLSPVNSLSDIKISDIKGERFYFFASNYAQYLMAKENKCAPIFSAPSSNMLKIIPNFINKNSNVWALFQCSLTR
ncbi:MAG: hypothetical protein HQK53_01755 [Oligoflexia bacterium]|nr:hypothetical protein [Oligoflexia bacterium]